MNEFDRLFNEYFGDEENNKPNLPKGFGFMDDLISKLNKDSFNFDGIISPEEAGLGEPSEVRTFEKNGITYTESIWKTPNGEIRKLSSKTPINLNDLLKGNIGAFGGLKGFSDMEDITPIEPKSLEEQLEEAKEDENYEECARLHELITKKKQDTLNKIFEAAEKRQKNKEKLEKGENLDNKGFPEEDEWNF